MAVTSRFDVTLVIPAHDDAATVSKLLTAANMQVPEGELLEVIVCDDTSPIPLSQGLHTEDFSHLNLRVIARRLNGGPGAARNTALEHVQTSWVIFMDSDEEPTSTWLARVLVLITGEDTADITEGLVTAPDGAQVTPFTHALEADASKDQHVGGNLLCRTSALARINGFSEEFYDTQARLHFREDADFWFRVQDAGLRTAFDPTLRAYHPLGAQNLMLPTKWARRYFFDPLLSKKHPTRFTALMRSRTIGPISLRSARHYVAFAEVLALLALAIVLPFETLDFCVIFGAIWVLSVAANCVAIAYGKHMRLGLVPALVLNGVTAPAVYTYKFLEGVVRYRHWPRF